MCQYLRHPSKQFLYTPPVKNTTPLCKKITTYMATY